MPKEIKDLVREGRSLECQAKEFYLTKHAREKLRRILMAHNRLVFFRKEPKGHNENGQREEGSH